MVTQHQNTATPVCIEPIMICQPSQARSLNVSPPVSRAIPLIADVNPIATVAMRQAIPPGCRDNRRHGGRGLVSRNSRQATVQVARLGITAKVLSSATD